MEEGDVECEGRESAEAEHRDLRINKGKEEEGRKELARRLEVIKGGLSRPAKVDVSGLLEKLNLVDDYNDGEGNDEN
jgi:hypothetical protein